MAIFDTTAAQNILKEVYLPPVREMLNNSTVLLKFLEKEIQETDGGLHFNIPIHVSRNEAAGVGRPEYAGSANLPTAGKQGYSNAQVPAKYLYSRIALSGPVIAATKNNKGSFLRALDAEMRGVAKDTRRAFNRQLNGDGRDILGVWSSTTSGTVAIYNNGLGDAGSDFFQTGAQTVDVYLTNNTTRLFASVQATRGAIDAGLTGRNITFADTTGMTTGTYVVPAGTQAAAAATGYSMTGIQAVISAANPPLLSLGLHGIDPANQPDWAAQVIYGTGSSESATAAGRVDLSFPAMQQVFSAISANSDYSEQDIKLILVSYQMRDKYVELCTNERKFFNNMKLDGGFEAVSYNGKPIVPDVHCKRHRMNFIAPESMAIFRLADLDWMDKDGSILYRLSSGDGDAYGATLFVYQELGCKVRNANGVLLNIND